MAKTTSTSPSLYSYQRVTSPPIMRQQNNQNPNLPITPNEISEAVVIFHEILLLKDLYLPRDKLLLKAARMTLPILELAITFFQI